MLFSNDADILKYEPILFGELYPAGQVLATGSGGTVSGTTFSKEGENFISSSVEAGGVINLRSEDGAIDGSFEVVSVDGETQLTVSIIRADGESELIAPPAATNAAYRISTYAPQAGEAAFQLMQYFGIDKGDPWSEIKAEDITDIDGLKRASVFAVIAGVYAMLSGKSEDENFREKSLYYQELFKEARQRCKIGIDLDDNGIADVTKSGDIIKLRRE